MSSRAPSLNHAFAPIFAAMLILGACGPIGASSSRSPGGSNSSTPSVEPHVMVIVLENREYSSVVNSPDLPYTNQLIANGGLATASYGVAHPSLPNYLALISGSTFGITNDCTDCTANGPNLADQLESAGFSWRAYMESMPSPCYQGAGADGSYAKKHDPFMYFPQISGNPSRCANVVPMTGMLNDFNSSTAPDFVFAVPNLCNDGHDCGSQTTDTWMANNLPTLRGSNWYQQGGIVIITWDEGTSEASCCGTTTGGHIATIVLSAKTLAGSTMDTPINHYGVLRTIESLYHLPYLGGASCACSGALSPLLGA